jgi:hypothetical protein
VIGKQVDFICKEIFEKKEMKIVNLENAMILLKHSRKITQFICIGFREPYVSPGKIGHILSTGREPELSVVKQTSTDKHFCNKKEISRFFVFNIPFPGQVGYDILKNIRFKIQGILIFICWC